MSLHPMHSNQFSARILSLLKAMLFSAVIIVSFYSSAEAQQLPPYLVTYGKDAKANEGDDDFRQTIFIKLKGSQQDTLWLRIFDPDCGGQIDKSFGGWDTKTRFTLYGGEGAYSAKGITLPNADEKALNSGKVLASEEFGDASKYDAEWFTLGALIPSQGEKVGNDIWFRLNVVTTAGNDANLYNVDVSSNQYYNTGKGDAALLNYKVTAQITKNDQQIVLRFSPQGKSKLMLNDFDLAGAKYYAETALRSNITLKSSADGVWNTNELVLDENEALDAVSVTIGLGNEVPNDVSFYVTDAAGEPIPVQLPLERIIKNTPPEIKYSVVPLADCYSVVFDAKETVDKDKNPITFLWNFGDGTTSTGRRAVHKYAKQDSYTVTLLASDNSGAVWHSSFVKFPMVFNKLPVPEFSIPAVAAINEDIVFDAGKSYDPDGSIKSYFWQFGDKKQGIGKVLTHQYDRAGEYEITLRIEDNSNSPCSFSELTKRIKINASPVASAGQYATVSPGEKVSFDASASKDPDGTIISYVWDFGDGTKGSGIKAPHAYEKPGVYTATLTVTDNAGVKNSTAVDKVNTKVNASPKAKTVLDFTVAEGELFSLDGSESTDPDGFITDFEWDFGDGTTGKGEKVSHYFDKYGKYKVRLKVYDETATQNNWDTTSLVVTVNRQPKALAGKNVIVTQSVVKLDALSSQDQDGKIQKFQWDFDDGKTSDKPVTEHVFEKPGAYKVKLKVEDNAGAENSAASDEIEVVINKKPVAKAGNNRLIAPGDMTTLDATGSYDLDGAIANYTWTISDGRSFTEPKKKISFDKPGIYRVQLRVQDNTLQAEAVDFDEFEIRVNAQPVAIAGNDFLIAPGDPITLDASRSYDPDGAITRFNWKLTDGREFTSMKVPLVFDKPGIVYAVLTIFDNTGVGNNSHSDTLKIHINAAPIANAGNAVYTCESTITLSGENSSDADKDGLSYRWDFGDGTEASGVKVIHRYNKAGTYPVILTVNDGRGLKNSSNSVATKVTINAAPKADAGPDLTICAGEVITFNGGNSSDAEGGVLKYHWDFGDGRTADGINPTLIYKLGGTYKVLLTVTDDSGLPCNFDTDEKIVRIIESPVALAGPDVQTCANTVIKFDGSASKDYDGVVNEFLWDFGDGTTGAGATPTHSYKFPGVYKVVLTITGDLRGECDNTDSDELIVTVSAAPIAVFESPDDYPVGKALVLSGSKSSVEGGSISTYEWDFGDGAKANGAEAKHTYSASGKYAIELKVTSNLKTECNTTILRRYIVINQSPVAKTIDKINTAANEEVIFDGAQSKDEDGTLTKYLWNFGDGQTAEGILVRHKYTVAGKYKASLTVVDNTGLENNSNTQKIDVVVNSAPVPVITCAETGCLNTGMKFSADASSDADGSIQSYLWDFGDGTKSSDKNPMHTYTSAGKYSVTLTVNDGSGQSNSIAKMTKMIRVNTLPVLRLPASLVICPVNPFTFSAGNSFDPDGDSVEYKWSFPDGTVLTGKDVSYSFKAPGNFKVKVTATDKCLCECNTVSGEIAVLVNSSPAIKVSAPAVAYVGGAHDEVLFNASESKDFDGDALTFAWDFGDGTTGTGTTVYHRYTKPGTYKVKVKANDNRNLNCSIANYELSITVKAR